MKLALWTAAKASANKKMTLGHNCQLSKLKLQDSNQRPLVYGMRDLPLDDTNISLQSKIVLSKTISGTPERNQNCLRPKRPLKVLGTSLHCSYRRIQGCAAYQGLCFHCTIPRIMIVGYDHHGSKIHKTRMDRTRIFQHG